MNVAGQNGSMNINISEVSASTFVASLINHTFPKAGNHGLSLLTNTTHKNYIIDAPEQGRYTRNITERSAYTRNLTEHMGYKENDFEGQFFVYSTVFTTILGIGGNFICLLVMVRPPFSKMAHSIMCAALALIDLVFMVFQLNHLFGSSYN